MLLLRNGIMTKINEKSQKNALEFWFGVFIKNKIYFIIIKIDFVY